MSEEKFSLRTDYRGHSKLRFFLGFSGKEYMALDLYILENGQPKEWIYSIDYEKWSLFEEAFEIFKAKTGLTIDQYSDTKFSSGFQTLIDVLKSVAPRYGKSAELFSEFITVLDTALRNGKNLIFVGD